MGKSLNNPQPDPIPCDGPAIWDLVIADMRERDRFGLRKHGVRLGLENGRDSLIDAYQEALDLAVYLRQEIERRKPPIAASERETPMEVKRCFESDGVIVANHAGCEQFTFQQFDRPNYCPNCGQRLKWGRV